MTNRPPSLARLIVALAMATLCACDDGGAPADGLTADTGEDVLGDTRTGDVGGQDSLAPGDTTVAANDTSPAPADVDVPTDTLASTDTAPTPDTAVPADTAVAEDTTPAADTTPSAHCPPPGPHGWNEGDRAGNLTFTDCDGNPVSIHDTCGAPATLIMNFYGW